MTPALLLVLAFFVAALLAQRALGRPACALCAAVSLSWITLGVLHWSGVRAADPVLLALLMGGSAVGLMYYLAARLPDRYALFRLPFLMSVLWAVYGALRGTAALRWADAALLLALWAAFGAVHAWRDHPRIRAIGARLLACCKDW